MPNTEPGYVFHGTSAWHWQRIVDEGQGLRPRRGKTGTQWENVPSHPDFVDFAASPVDIVWNYREQMQRGELEVLAVKLSIAIRFSTSIGTSTLLKYERRPPHPQKIKGFEQAPFTRQGP
jgi:hypothetical protein